MRTQPSGAVAQRPRRLDFILKIASRCNLNCSYCYVYNKGDSTWANRPPVMSDQVYQATLARIRRHCEASGQDAVALTFHGGEPTLVGSRRFSSLCVQAEAALEGVAQVGFSIQTNGTLLDEAWVESLRRHGVSVGVSMDGPPDEHDRFRVDAQGRGSYDSVVRGLTLLQAGGITPQVLCVVRPGGDGLRTHRHFVDLGVRRIGYLLPDFTHDTIAGVRALHGPTPCADFLLPILEDWWRGANGSGVDVILFMDMARMILGGGGTTDELMGNRPLDFVFVETDGTIEGLDVLRVCGEGMAATGLNVLEHDFVAIAQASPLHRKAIMDGFPLPRACADCPERATCAGGALPHRFSSANGFDNRTVWCLDMLALFGRLRELMGVTPRETVLRSEVLAELKAEQQQTTATKMGGT